MEMLGEMNRGVIPDIKIHFADEAKTMFLESMPVKEKVALMESWGRTTSAPKPKVPARRSTSSNSSVQKPPFSPPTVHYRDPPMPATESKMHAKHPPVKPRRSAREAKQRRSMSDPNLQKSFQAMKELWDKKVQQQSDTSPVGLKPHWSPKSRGNSLSSSHSADNDTNDKLSKDSVHTTIGKVSNVREKRTGPPTPTKPKPAPLRLAEEYSTDPRKKANSFASQPVATTPTSVKNRARMFDVPGESNANKDFSPSDSLHESLLYTCVTTRASCIAYVAQMRALDKAAANEMNVNKNQASPLHPYISHRAYYRQGSCGYRFLMDTEVGSFKPPSH